MRLRRRWRLRRCEGAAGCGEAAPRESRAGSGAEAVEGDYRIYPGRCRTLGGGSLRARYRICRKPRRPSPGVEGAATYVFIRGGVVPPPRPLPALPPALRERGGLHESPKGARACSGMGWAAAAEWEAYIFSWGWGCDAEFTIFLQDLALAGGAGKVVCGGSGGWGQLFRFTPRSDKKSGAGGWPSFWG